MSVFRNFVQGQRRRQSVKALSALHPAALRDIGIEPDRIGETVDAMLSAEAGEPAAKPRPPAGLGVPDIFIHGTGPYRWGRAG